MTSKKKFKLMGNIPRPACTGEAEKERGRGTHQRCHQQIDNSFSWAFCPFPGPFLPFAFYRDFSRDFSNVSIAFHPFPPFLLFYSACWGIEK
jgi:hypothetical protein